MFFLNFIIGGQAFVTLYLLGGVPENVTKVGVHKEDILRDAFYEWPHGRYISYMISSKLQVGILF